MHPFKKAMLLGLNRVTSKRKISGDFSVRYRMEPVSGYIRGDFPLELHMYPQAIK
jgi:hypothetical protein